MDRENQTEITKPKRKRSPAYPGINLETALDLARKLKRHQGEHPTHPQVILEVWGYKGQTGPGAVALAALNYFSLIDDQGTGEDRRVKISELALGILWDDREESLERDAAIKQAALSPRIHRKLWDWYNGQLPPNDADLRWRLLKEEKFSEKGADEFIRQFRATIAFAKLESSDTLSGHEEDKIAPEKEVLMTSGPVTPAPRGSTTATIGGSSSVSATISGEISFPLTPDKWVKISLPARLTKREWSSMLKKLEVFKDGFLNSTDMDEEDEKDRP